MATEIPMRMVENGGARKCPSSRDHTTFRPPLKTTAAEELGSILRGHRVQGSEMGTMPNRSGSAPPSMEGSFAAIANLLARNNVNMDETLANLGSAIEDSEIEEKLRSDPAYVAYYCSHVNLNPRLPPPLISRENRRLVSHIGGLGNSWRLTSLDDSGNGSLHLSRGSLFTHNEEPEDEKSLSQNIEFGVESRIHMPIQNVVSSSGRHKSLVDLIQEIELISNGETLHTPFASSPNVGEKFSTIHEDGTMKEINVGNEASIRGLDISGTDESNLKNAEEHAYRRSTPLQPASILNGTQHRGPVVHGQGSYQHPPARMERYAFGHPRSTHVEGQSTMHSPGLTPPLYTAASYINSNTFYPNLQMPGMFAPQYNMGGYALGSAVLPPYMAAYSPHSGFSLSAPALNGRGSGVSTGQGISNVGDAPHMNKMYGQYGLTFQPPFADPLPMSYFHHPLEDAYGAPSHFGHFSRGGVGGSMDSFASQNDVAFTSHLADQKLEFQPNGSLNIPSPRSSNFYGSPRGVVAISQFPGSPLASPILPSSPIGGMSHLGRRNDVRFSQGSSRNGGIYSGWQGQRGVNGFDDAKRNTFLEELKSSNARKFELSDIVGRIVEFSVDQHGSRFIQQKLENCSFEDKAAVFSEVLPHASKLMTDVFGNYVIQKFFEHGRPEQRKELADQLTGQMLQLSLQMYGCRVIQKALEVIELDQKTILVEELDGQVMRCVRDQNGNHVIQKCIERVPTERIGFIISAFRGQVATLSTHPYGCRVIQRVLEHCCDEGQSQCIVDEILDSAYLLAQDQYGNYVTQHVLERGKPQERSQIISKLTGNIVPLSQHKYASNVVEKCLEHGDAAERELLVEEIIGQSEENDNLLAMMKDQYANYVVQKILEVSNDKHREVLLSRIKVHLHALKKYTYGKHIVARFEQLSVEDGQALEPSSS
ncbi:pumilio homolog 5 isoform X2 [Rhodamnia argentea]|uniref:Pumilio homolog 5 isoform X2 n=1 Tax=Rhodamnia argentea TaxID=178133 RepID=A0ABM3GZN8_9MYRT|nr:pumilio homolog 5 isoform X2 [Rhodamnia argentea]